MDNQSSFSGAVERLHQILMEETDALRRLDHQTLDQLTSRKVELVDELSHMSRAGADAGTLKMLAFVRERALVNQMLMVHARDLTQGVFDAMTGNAYGVRGGGARLLEVKG